MPTTKYRKIPLTELEIDTDYQRPLDEGRIDRMAEDFRPEMLGVLEVSQRNGVGNYKVFDGQHRLRLLERMGWESVGCLVHVGMTQAEEADLFARLQKQRKNIHPIEAFRALVVAKEPTTVEINDLVNQHGFRVAHANKDPNNIASVAALRRIYTAGNLSETLGLIRRVWDGDMKAGDPNFLLAVSRLERGYGHRITDEKIALLQEEPVGVLVRRARSRAAALNASSNGGVGSTVVTNELLKLLRKAADLQGAPRGGTPKKK